MKHFFAFAAFVAGVAALPQVKRAACAGNDASDRSVWCDLDINTNFYSTVPDTGVTRTYSLTIAEATAAPDGFDMPVMQVNGQIPAPPIIADWGDFVEVHLENQVELQGASIHFHGLHQKGTFQDDGVPAITQCPLAPGDNMVYRWRATQYGTSWYHSHFSMQAWNGVFGPIIINGPASANYDEDLGSIILSDWSHITADEQQAIANTNPVISQTNGLINGTNVWEGPDGTVGKRFETVFEAGKSYRIRLINSAIDSFFTFSIDSHKLKVIASDFVPIEPYETDSVMITMGQRYDIIVEANQEPGDYWMRSLPGTCSFSDNPQNIKGIVRYDSSSTADPTNSTAATQQACHDEDPALLTPIVSVDVGDATQVENLAATFYQDPENGWFKWQIGNTTMVAPWEQPSIKSAFESDFSFTEQEAVIHLPNANQWVQLVLTQAGPFNPPHPIHLHGHDFHILAQGAGTFTNDTPLNKVNPPRRDVATLLGTGYLVIAWQLDNPGIWLMHCHIGYHTFEGFGLQFVERQDEIGDLIRGDEMSQVCDNWDSFVAEHGIVQNESGI
ncbi:multicopper oxidase-like protein [Pseudovirgaria hyperparasitica]|uniref:Multicopper oxidase-like protein n=1 Tax=Pseudovirgaria hyperparasitica TaxID=470096 RepID=A0A6A6VYL8_9PEZI|nr:multicopper oxidase-like protein [Pseudovirgaria hyperparasitica]KAF2755732.1 multicopper oxidase-like protein [Pseudovirgaria hyperparasitica]